VHLGLSLHLVVTLSPSVPQDKLREGSLIAREMLRFTQHDKLRKNFRRGVLGANIGWKPSSRISTRSRLFEHATLGVFGRFRNQTLARTQDFRRLAIP
jgi:hypothetical protein